VTVSFENLLDRVAEYPQLITTIRRGRTIRPRLPLRPCGRSSSAIGNKKSARIVETIRAPIYPNNRQTQKPGAFKKHRATFRSNAHRKPTVPWLGRDKLPQAGLLARQLRRTSHLATVSEIAEPPGIRANDLQRWARSRLQRDSLFSPKRGT
jgi:hypothetical protein